MSESLILVVFFVAGIAALPWLVRRLQDRMAPGSTSLGGAKVLSAVAVGPQQRVVTVQVGTGDQDLVLVLGVTANAVSCLHKWVPDVGSATLPEKPLSSRKEVLP